MKISKAQLKQVIKEELESVLGEEKTTGIFLNAIRGQFSRAKNRATVEKMAHHYDEMIATHIGGGLDATSNLSLSFHRKPFQPFRSVQNLRPPQWTG